MRADGYKTILIAATFWFGGQLAADETSFPEILDPGIPGTPKLGQPILVMGSAGPILTEKHGLAAPALWDWNGDGKRDLLVGEFETNSGEDFPMGADGSTIRVYLNVGADRDPKFTDAFEWARDTKGTIMEVPQWCCIGFTPQFYDLDADGHLDMITGQYHPGEVTWFRGSDDGFLPGETLPRRVIRPPMDSPGGATTRVSTATSARSITGSTPLRVSATSMATATTTWSSGAREACASARTSAVPGGPASPRVNCCLTSKEIRCGLSTASCRGRTTCPPHTFHLRTATARAVRWSSTGTTTAFSTCW